MPNANKVPILMIALSIIAVSFSLSPSEIFIVLAIKGSAAILFTFSIIISIGRNANTFASLENSNAPFYYSLLLIKIN